MKVGDRILLPSGKVMTIRVAAEPDNPWQAIETGWHWQVCKLHPEVRAACYAFDGKRPAQLDEADARALAAALNQAE